MQINILDVLQGFIDLNALKIACISVIFTLLRYMLKRNLWRGFKFIFAECAFTFSAVYIAIPILEDLYIPRRYYMIAGAVIGWAGFESIVKLVTAVLHQVIDAYLTSKIGTPRNNTSTKHELGSKKNTSLSQDTHKHE